jgi:hypothetical protein
VKESSAKGRPVESNERQSFSRKELENEGLALLGGHSRPPLAHLYMAELNVRQWQGPVGFVFLREKARQNAQQW